MKRSLVPAAILLALAMPAAAVASKPAAGKWRGTASENKASVGFSVTKTRRGYKISTVSVSGDVRCLTPGGRASTQRLNIKVRGGALTARGKNWRYVKSRELTPPARTQTARVTIGFNADRRAKATIKLTQDQTGINPLECTATRALVARPAS